MSRLKKMIGFSMLFILFSVCIHPVLSVNAAEVEPLLIYLRNDFEEQEIGELPYGLWFAGDKSAFGVSNIVRGEDVQNKAVKLSPSQPNSRMYHYAGYAPISDDFVMSFSFMCDSVSSTDYKRLVQVRYNATAPRHSRYDESESIFAFLKLNDKVTVNGAVVYEGIQANVWYDMDFLFHMNDNSTYVDVYINGVCIKSKVSLPYMKNVASFHFYAPTEESHGAWYIDDLKNYISDTVLSDNEFANWANLYKQSDLTPPMKFETSRAYQYDKFVFAALYNRFVGLVEGKRLYNNGIFYELPTPVYEKDGEIFMPVRPFCEAMGASVVWDGNSGSFTVEYNDRTMTLIPGDVYFYMDGKISKQKYAPELKDGSACMQLKALTTFFDIKIIQKDQLLFFGEEAHCPWNLGPMLVNTLENTLEEEIYERITLNLLFDYPSASEIEEKYYNIHSNDAYKRFFSADFEQINTLMETDSYFRKVVNKALTIAQQLYESDLPTYETVDGKRADYDQLLSDSAYYLSMAYKLTGDSKYKDRLWEYIETVSQFPDFHPAHILNIGNMAEALGVAYNWLYNDWTATQLQTIENTILTKIFPIFTEGYRTPIYSASTATAYGYGNMPLVVKNGLVASCLALFDRHPTLCSELLSCSIKSCSVSMLGCFFPEGAYREGISYWQFTMRSLPFLISNLEEQLGDDFGLKSFPGFSDTFYYPLALSGSNKTFPFGDGSAEYAEHASMMWWANQSGEKFFASKAKNRNTGAMLDILYYVDTTDYEDNMNELNNDFYYKIDESVTMRSGWSKTDTYIAFHGGLNEGYHGHVDNGDFQFDMLGERWADAVPKEDYNLKSSGSYGDASSGNPYTGGYYRNMGEGHNTICADLANNPFSMETSAFSEIAETRFSNVESYAVMNLTQTNKLYKCALRGVKFNKVSNEIVVQDDITAISETEFWWFMHTKADIVISPDGKTATLTKNNKSIIAEIVSQGDETFQILEAKRLPGYSAVAPLETANDGYQRLAIQKKDSTQFKVSVSFRPIDVPAGKYSPLELWS